MSEWPGPREKQQKQQQQQQQQNLQQQQQNCERRSGRHQIKWVINTHSIIQCLWLLRCAYRSAQNVDL